MIVSEFNEPPYSCPNFDSALQHIDECDGAIDTLSSLLDDIRNEIEQARKINDALRGEGRRIEMHCGDLEAEKEELEERIQSLTDEVNSLQEEVTFLSSELADIKEA